MEIGEQDFEALNAWTLVSFYGEWCPPCRAELVEWKGKGLPLVVIDVDKTPMAAWNVARRMLFDYREDLALPTSLLLDDKGRVAKVYRGVTTAAQVLADMRAVTRPALPLAGTWLAGPGRRNYAEMATAMAEAGLLTQAATYFAMAAPDEEMRVNYAALLLEQKQGKAAGGNTAGRVADESESAGGVGESWFVSVGIGAVGRGGGAVRTIAEAADGRWGGGGVAGPGAGGAGAITGGGRGV